MLDSRLRPLIIPVVDVVGRGLGGIGITANMVTLAGLGLGVAAFFAIIQSAFMLALVLILLSRVADGLDGAVARHNGVSDFGGFFDIVCDFIFYSLIPFGFALAEPDNALAACFLIFSFMGTGSSFLAFAIMAEKRGMETQAFGKKSFYYLTGLAEATETIIVLSLMCLFPDWFTILAWGFGALCWVTTVTRIAWAWQNFGK